ncbi:efflux RND transporter periplasmic adaptor subunit [Oscillochloris sp. ZM17-4]|uniref:efflux RND transporter periplasmic adaptor subunit n=1 Tax=Oscillochloris sp. ZM17-4 TaxID=2866714 RepID=UPI001C72AC20|nr:efflux RND transporter periplasmic adaptor subunit [Oscillochloris sp. ZM17-4]MBX0326666.1 efflux RND transporter periplasmic adaptor subunit [Oscillochloris sp. ZM17-4]
MRSAQDSYSTTYWKNRELEKLPGDLPQSAKDAEAAALRAVSNAEEGLRQAEIAAESARLAEQTGIQAAEQQVNQSQAALDKLQAGATPDQIAAASAQVAQARSQLDALTNPTTASQRAQREASVAQAQAALESAQYNRSQADLKAPFAGVVAEVNIDVGDPSSSAGAAAIRLIDLSELTAEVDVSDVDIAGVQVGQAASMIVQSLPNVTFSGKVISIAPAATVSGNVRTYTVRISIDDQSGLLAGMRVRATIAPAS